MPGSTKKDLYIAKSLGSLNEMAELPSKLKTTNVKLLVKTADKMLKEAEHSEMVDDEERAYVLFMKYFNVVTFMKKTADYKKDKTYYDGLLGVKNLLNSIDRAEKLSASLKDRYDQVEAEKVANELASLDAVEKENEEQKKKEKNDEKKEKKVEDKPPVEKEVETNADAGQITCLKLYEILRDRDAQVIIMDVRPIADYQESRMDHKNIINVPAEAIKPGTTVNYIEKALPMDSLSLWKQRGNIDHIILMDWNTSFMRVKIGTPLKTLKDALFKYDSTVIIKSEPLILDGGYEQWLLHYPTQCLNPDFKKLTKPVVITSQAALMDFDYPDFEETFMKKPPAPAIPSSSNTVSEPNTPAQSVNGLLNGEMAQTAGGSMPRIDRTTKPKIDRSTKNNVTSIDVKASSSGSGSLYPDVKAISSGTMFNQNRAEQLKNPESRASSSISGPNSRYASTRADSDLSGSRAAVNVTKDRNDSNSSLPKDTSDISQELEALDKLKKQKQEELEKLQLQNERIRKESHARMEKLRTEEKRLSDLEDLRRKQQTDVVDLLRMKKNLQQNITEEEHRTDLERLTKTQEEEERRQELDVIAREEQEKLRRQNEVDRLRMARKKKEEDDRKMELEKKDQEEKAIQVARERARQEEDARQRDLTAAEDRARQLRLEEQKKATDEAERMREKKEVEDRLKREKELQVQLEKERQAALEEHRRQQALVDRQEQEKREQIRLERERQEKERLEKERKEREEIDRKRAEEAKRIADEKLRLMNEAKPKPKAVPSPNLLVGWEKQLDSRTNRYFYINHNDGTTQWDAPTTPEQQKGGIYTTQLKEEPKEIKRGLSRSNSSPNIAQMVENEKKLMPSVDRRNKPLKQPEPESRPVPMPVKRRDLNPMYGNVGRALTGLRNLGNTCYMNSTIQCLNNTSPLVTYLLTDMYLYDINRESFLGNNGEVADDFAYMVKALWTGQYRYITPRDFKSVVGKHQPMFSGYDQQDSQEFLTFLLDGLHEGLNKVKTRPKIPEQDNDNLKDSVAAELAWKNHKLQNESIIVELFQGQLKSTIMCLACRKKSVTFQAFMFLSLPLPSSSRCSLQDCLKQFSAEEKMTGSSRWKCPRCKSYRDSVKKIEIWKLPRILLIALNRFVYEGQWRTKINANVDFPVKGMDFSSYVSGPICKPYNLYGISNHFGTLDGGHYTACCRNPVTRKWYKYDDHEVYDVSEFSIKTSAAYVLYYTSIELPPPDFRPNFR